MRAESTPGRFCPRRLSLAQNWSKRLMTVVGKRPQQAAPERHSSERSWMFN